DETPGNLKPPRARGHDFPTSGTVPLERHSHETDHLRATQGRRIIGERYGRQTSSGWGRGRMTWTGEGIGEKAAVKVPNAQFKPRLGNVKSPQQLLPHACVPRPPRTTVAQAAAEENVVPEWARGFRVRPMTRLQNTAGILRGK